ncbi:MAG: hypothetical protein NTZ10_06975 [Candidatus Saganbacteria bacterium]|nr:hypothetical protein [Candidatus Saganbacteria bacterium]
MEISRIGAVGASPVSSALPFKVGMPGEHIPVHTPAGMEIRQRIFRGFGIEVLDSDVRFSKAELIMIEKILLDLRKKKKNHLLGVKEIVKNKEMRVRLLNNALIHAGGAYVAEQKRIYLFDELPQEEIQEVLVHEIGHAVNHFNLSFERFMDFVRQSGWNMTEMRRVFFNSNRMYQFGVKPLEIPKDKWGNVWNRFSLNSLSKDQDTFGEIFLQLPRNTGAPWDKNPLEKFAWAYEWFYDKKDRFKLIAEKAKEEGDPTLSEAFKFMEKEVFSDEEQKN